MRILSFIFIVVLVIVGISFACLNAEKVTFHYYFASKQIALSLLLLASLIIGVFLGLFVSLFGYIKLYCEVKQLRRQLTKAKSNVNAVTE